jgi:tyrosyl-tRNA synthetase
MFTKPKIDNDPAKIDRLLTRGVTEVIDREQLRAKLLSGKQLRVKLGFDPTGSKIHIGRAIVLRKLREFQDLGHKVVFIVGDHTARIGDPSDKLGKRPMMTKKEVLENTHQYKHQIAKIIDMKKAEFVFNSLWLEKLTFAEGATLAESFTVAQMLARRNFKERFEKGEEISVREFMYPLMQGYDSVMVKADVELGGFDQLFNLQAGRVIQPYYGQPAQDILTIEMLEGTDGRKMSTSWGNVINITDEPNDMFGKVMSVKDELVDKYFKLCTNLSDQEIAALTGNPKDKKMRLAHEIVKLYHGSASSPQVGEKAAASAAEEFTRIFSKGNIPTDIKEVQVNAKEMSIVELLVTLELATSKSDARRLIDQGGVRINEIKKSDVAEVLTIEKGMVVQVGPRKFVRIG